MTYVIDVPQILDERSFDQVAGGFADAEGAVNQPDCLMSPAPPEGR